MIIRFQGKVTSEVGVYLRVERTGRVNIFEDGQWQVCDEETSNEINSKAIYLTPANYDIAQVGDTVSVEQVGYDNYKVVAVY